MDSSKQVPCLTDEEWQWLVRVSVNPWAMWPQPAQELFELEKKELVRSVTLLNGKRWDTTRAGRRVVAQHLQSAKTSHN